MYIEANVLTKEKLDYLKTRGGAAGSRTLKILGENLKFIDALNTDLGFELLKDLVERHETLMMKIGKIDATDEDKIEYKLCQHMINRWASRIKTYQETYQKVDKKLNILG